MISRRTKGIVAAVVILVAILVVAWVATTSGDNGKPSGAACKAAMQRQFDYGMTHPDAPAGRQPTECSGIPKSDLQRYASEIMQRYVNGSS